MTPAKLVALVAAVLVLSAGALWFFWSSEPRGSTSAEVASPEIARLKDSAPVETPVPLEGERELSVAIAAESPAPAADEVLPADPAGIEVSVVRGRDPVPGATLWLVDCPDYDDIPLYAWEWFPAGHIDGHLEDEGVRYELDARGRTKVAVPKNDAVVVAEHGDLWGYAVLPVTPHEPVVVEMFPDYDLRVRVVDERGNLRIQVRVELRADSEWAWEPDLVANTREADGIALLRHAGYVVHKNASSEQSSRVSLMALGWDVPSVLLDAKTAPPDVLELVSSECGELLVEVIGPDGDPWSDRVEIELALVDDEGYEAGPTVTRESAHERAQFDDIGLGETIEARVRRMGKCFVSRARGPGPRAPGEIATLVVKLGEGAATLTGRLVDASGVPLASTWVDVRLEVLDGTTRSSHCSFRTQRDGRFVLEVEPVPQTRAPIVLTIDPPEGLESEISDAVVRLVAPLLPETRELGDVAFLATEILAEGRVVDDLGRPIAGVEVTASPVRKRSVEREALSSFVPSCGARTDEEGRFRIVGRFDAPEISVQLDEPGRWSEAETFARGTRDIVLRIERQGAIAGRMLVPDPDVVAKLELGIEEPDSGDIDFMRTQRLSDALDSSGAFELPNVAPGMHDVVVRDRVTHTTVLRVSRVEVRGDEVTRDARLDPIDLRSVVRVLVLSIVDAAGEPVFHGQIRAHDPARPDALALRVDFFDGSFELAHAGRGLDLEISAPGYLSETVSGVVEDQTITLREPARLRFVLGEGVREPSPPEFVVVVLFPEGNADGWPEEWTTGVGGEDIDVFFSPRLGRMQVSIGVCTFDAEAGEVSAAADVALDAPWSIDVVSGAELQEFTLPVTQAQLDQALAELRSNR